MRLRLVFVAVSLVAQIQAQGPADRTVLDAMRRVDAAITDLAVVHRGQVAPDVDLVIAIGGKDVVGPDRLFFFWEEHNKLGIFFQERGRPQQVYPVANEPGFYDCMARVERATVTDTVISCAREKGGDSPHRKFVYDMGSKKLVSYSFYQPVAMHWILAKEGGAVVLGHDADQYVAVDFEPGREPEFRVLGKVEAQRLAQQNPDSNLDSRAYFYPPEPIRPIPFGATRNFTWVTRADGPVEQAADGKRISYALPISTREQLAILRPKEADTFTHIDPMFDERIGPWQLVGNQLWFGKTFYNGEGVTGVGGFGYFDAGSRSYRIFTPPEVVDRSVSAILVEPDAVWLALVGHGEYGDFGQGALRYDRQSGKIQKFETHDLIGQFLRVGDRLLLATNQGVSVIYAGRLRRYFVDRTSDGNWHMLEAVK